MKLAACISAFLLSACGVESFTEDMKLRQAFNIYTAGNYSFSETCPGAGYIDGVMSISNEIVMVGHTVCNVTKLDFSSEPVGPKITLENCRSDGGDEAPATIIVEALGGRKSILHGWGDKPVQIYQCAKTKKKEPK